MKLYIPEIGDTLVLSEDWTFELHDEHRNEKLISHFKLNKFFDSLHQSRDKEYADVRKKYDKGVISYEEFNEFHFKFYQERWHGISHPVTLKEGSMLKVDRIYIRKGQDSFSSVSFYHYDKIDSKKSNGRFWAKLADVNTGDCRFLIMTGLPDR